MISKYLKRITLSNLTYIISIYDLMIINVERLMIDGQCLLELIELIHIHPLNGIELI